MTGSQMSYPALARLIGRPESTGGQIIVSTINVAAAQRRAAAAMSVAMTKGDVEGVLAALRRLGVRAADQGVCVRQVKSLRSSRPCPLGPISTNHVMPAIIRKGGN